MLRPQKGNNTLLNFGPCGFYHSGEKFPFWNWTDPESFSVEWDSGRNGNQKFTDFQSVKGKSLFSIP